MTTAWGTVFPGMQHSNGGRNTVTSWCVGEVCYGEQLRYFMNGCHARHLITHLTSGAVQHQGWFADGFVQEGTPE